jgi:hypothetical protein
VALKPVPPHATFDSLNERPPTVIDSDIVSRLKRSAASGLKQLMDN